MSAIAVRSRGYSPDIHGLHAKRGGHPPDIHGLHAKRGGRSPDIHGMHGNAYGGHIHLTAMGFFLAVTQAMAMQLAGVHQPHIQPSVPGGHIDIDGRPIDIRPQRMGP